MLFFISLFTALIATLLCRPLARWTNMMSQPNRIVAQHTVATPCLGGLAIAIGAVTGSFIADSYVMARAGLLWRGGLAFLLLGLIDDAIALRPFVKLGLQTVLVAALLGFQSESPGEPANMLRVALGTLWVVGIVNAVNLTDVCDGLVSGLACIALVTIAMTGGISSQWALALAGASAGFLVFNFPPASIFLGDAGSHFLGYNMAVLTIPAGFAGAGLPAFGEASFGPVLLGVYIFEMVFITKMRMNKGLKWYKGSPDHFSLRMQAAGMTKTSTVTLAWCAAAACAIAAYLITATSMPLLSAGLIAALLIFFSYAWHWLERHEVPFIDDSPSRHRP